MKSYFAKLLLVSVFAIPAIGCEPNPVVVDDDDDAATVIDGDDDADVVVPDVTPDADTDVNLGTEGTDGVDVNVNPGAPATESGADNANTPGTTEQ